MKNNILLSISVILLFFSCHQPQESIDGENDFSYDIKAFNNENERFYYVQDIIKKHGFTTKQTSENMYQAKAVNIRAIDTRSVKIAYGYDERKVLERGVSVYGYSNHPNVEETIPMKYEICEYIKYIEIPSGYAMAIPPPVDFQNLGYSNTYEPSFFAYTPIYISSNSGKDKYALLTYTWEFLRYAKTNKPLNQILYRPEGRYEKINPETFTFKYQYTKW